MSSGALGVEVHDKSGAESDPERVAGTRLKGLKAILRSFYWWSESQEPSWAAEQDWIQI